MLLCEPYLLDPSADRVNVVWHTEQPGHGYVLVGPAVATMSDSEAVAAATGTPDTGPGWRRVEARFPASLELREDADSRVPGRTYAKVTTRYVYRHLAEVGDLGPGRTAYRVVHVDVDQSTVTATYSLAPVASGPVTLLLTSDHQLSPMTAANLEKVAAVAGVELDGVLVAGDMVNVPDRASDWFDSLTGPAFFAAMQGRAEVAIAGRTYRGAPLAQHTPLFVCPGNHEVMGRAAISESKSLDEEFNDPRPWADVLTWPERAGDWLIAHHAWNVFAFEGIFPRPKGDAVGVDACSRPWWSRTIGDVHVIGLFVTQVWRTPAAGVRGRYQESPSDLDSPQRWGLGQHIFQAIHRGSVQYQWLEQELVSPAAQRARYRVVMYHHPGHGLGANSVPPFTDPVQVTESDRDGTVQAVTYQYPASEDYILRDLEPLFSANGVHLVLNGHSHIWNRFRNADGVNWLETSNVGNTHGAFDVTSGRSREVPERADYVRQGDPGGLSPIVPTLAPLVGADGAPLPYVSSNDITVFSILDSASGTVRSYRFDTREPDAEVILFDEFPLAPS